jgi:tRNA (mo5U34)-methyltransferase
MTKSLEEIKWWHQVPLDDGRITPGRVAIYQQEKRYLFSDVDFRGKSVLDIGAWDGYFSFKAEKLGARRVVSLDNPEFRWGGLDGYHFLHDHFKSSAEWKKGTIYHLPDEMFDVILCFGVPYHLSDPLLGIVNCFQRSNDIVIIESLMYVGEKPHLRLLEPNVGIGPVMTGPSSPYTMSTGFIEMLGRLNGFELVKHEQPFAHRGSMMFKLTKRTPCPYKPTCFPIAPAIALPEDVPTPAVP